MQALYNSVHQINKQKSLKMKTLTLKVLKKSDYVSISFGEWFDKVNGNTYYDATVTVNKDTIEIPYQYGYNAGDKQSIDEALKAAGYRVRVSSSWATAYGRIHTSCSPRLKRELNK